MIDTQRNIYLDKYIETEVEVRLRVHDEKFKKIAYKLNVLLVLVAVGMILPVILHAAKLI